MGDAGVNFEFATATRIVFGEGRLSEAGELAAGLGKRALVVEGASRRAGPLTRLLEASGVSTVRFPVAGEPTTGMVEAGTALARDSGCDLVVGMGGGSVIDAAKAIAALLTNPGALLTYLEVVGEGRPLAHRPAPFFAIPTTAGTGAEVTRNSVLGVEAAGVKVSLRSPLMLAAIALVDPELTYDLPPELTATTGLDALTQCIEPFVSINANPITDGLAREGMARAAASLRTAFHDGADRLARREMAVASLCGGLALANAKLGAVHGIAAPLGGRIPVPHGAVCARLLGPVVAANLRALRTRAPDSPALARYAEVARILTGDPDAAPDDAVTWIDDLVRDFAIPGLARYGLGEDVMAGVVAGAKRASSMRGNPIELTDEELGAILRAAV
jgi:alcohol dehydrogenase class IV